MFSMLTYALNTYLTLTKINKFYIYDDQSVKINSVHLFFEAGYLSPMVSILRYYILVSYRSQNYGIEPSLKYTDSQR